jgi:hypothetical protein
MTLIAAAPTPSRPAVWAANRPADEVLTAVGSRPGGLTQLSTLHQLYAAGARVIAVASRPAQNTADLTAADETGPRLARFVTFADAPKPAPTMLWTGSQRWAYT